MLINVRERLSDKLLVTFLAIAEASYRNLRIVLGQPYYNQLQELVLDASNHRNPFRFGPVDGRRDARHP